MAGAVVLMPALPAFLLRRRVTIRPYLGVWGSYGPPGEPVRCAIDEKIATALQAAGVVRLTMFTVVAPLDTHCPEGSLVDMGDGRAGYASAVARHTGGGLPTPDHLEIAVTVGSAGPGAPLGGELVVILRRVPAGEDRYHNQRFTTVEVPVTGAAVRVVGSDEKGTLLSDTLEVTLPPGTAVTANDRLRVRGLVYEVDGTPETDHDPMTGTEPGVKVIARRVAGG